MSLTEFKIDLSNVIHSVLSFVFCIFVRVAFILPESALGKSIQRKKRPLGASTESRMQIRGGCSGGLGATTTLLKKNYKKRKERMRET